MKLTQLFGALAVAAGLLTAGTSSAATIKGNITFAGGVDLDGSIATATQAVSFRSGIVTGNQANKADVIDLTGDFLTYFAGGLADFTSPWTFGSGKTGLWSYGGFTFDLLSSQIDAQSNSGLLVSGKGIITGNGFDATTGSFTFGTQNPETNGFFSFRAGTTAVPEGGTAIAMLGLALLGLEGARRRLKAAKA